MFLNRNHTKPVPVLFNLLSESLMSSQWINIITVIVHLIFACVVFQCFSSPFRTNLTRMLILAIHQDSRQDFLNSLKLFIGAKLTSNHSSVSLGCIFVSIVFFITRHKTCLFITFLFQIFLELLRNLFLSGLMSFVLHNISI